MCWDAKIDGTCAGSVGAANLNRFKTLRRMPIVFSGEIISQTVADWPSSAGRLCLIATTDKHCSLEPPTHSAMSRWPSFYDTMDHEACRAFEGRMESRIGVECDGDRWHGPDRYVTFRAFDFSSISACSQIVDHTR
jgi:hypothetical protein